MKQAGLWERVTTPMVASQSAASRVGCCACCGSMNEPGVSKCQFCGCRGRVINKTLACEETGREWCDREVARLRGKGMLAKVVRVDGNRIAVVVKRKKG